MALPEKLPSDLTDCGGLPPPMVRLREMGVYERLYYLCSLDHPKQFSIAAEIDGDLPLQELPHAFARLQRRHPLLNVEIHDQSAFGGRPRPAFYISDHPIEVALRPLVDDDDWMREIEYQQVLPLASAPGPLMRATVFHRPGRAQILLTFHHAIADGMSAVFVLRDLVAALAGQHIGLLSSRPSCDTLTVMHPEFTRSCDPKPPQKLDADALRAIGAEASRQASLAGRPSVKAVALDKVLTRRLREKARTQGTTVHGALSAAQTLSGYEQRPGIPYTIVSPLDLRELLGVNDESCGVYIGVSRHVHLASNQESFWALARQATDEIALAKNITATSKFMKSVMTNLPASAQPDLAMGLMTARHRDAMISNLGRLSIRQVFGDLRISAVWGPVYHAQAPQSRFLGAATVGCCLRLVETTPSGTMPLLGSVRQWLEVATTLSA
ncbi:Condensation domain-containing protein [Rhizobium sp. NFR07]|uniref:phthiocerol/phthiodiolone dimycocerosyl transferase family protein n=1 Tax=Rhizobium sp. NFR07 TaxID=1566262 RepID=UPI0008E955F5|nr:condensation domain-containing protein [Rhizobium sp. NFR07]SFB39794.1 Condensation domain-containing protein [Rhizobium sp. NFR07]